MQELTYWDSAVFLTLTYDDEHLPQDQGLQKGDLRGFFKRLRRRLEPNLIKYYACGEYGEETHRPHYHAIVFGTADAELIRKCWTYGFVSIGTVTAQSCRYVAQYVQKKYNGDFAKQVYGNKQIPYQVQSQGLGLRYLLDNPQLQRDGGYTVDGVPRQLPRYYLKKLKDKDKAQSQALEFKTRIKSIQSDMELMANYLKRGLITPDYYAKYLKSKGIERVTLMEQVRNPLLAQAQITQDARESTFMREPRKKQ